MKRGHYAPHKRNRPIVDHSVLLDSKEWAPALGRPSRRKQAVADADATLRRAATSDPFGFVLAQLEQGK